MSTTIGNTCNKIIDDIYYYISLDSIKYANETTNNIVSRILDLELFPFLGKMVLELNKKNFREILYKNYRIIYEVSENSKTIFIHFIMHSKRIFKSFYKSYIYNN